MSIYHYYCFGFIPINKITRDTNCSYSKQLKAVFSKMLLTWQMTEFIHELVLHMVVVMARVMFCVGVLVVFCVRVLMMNGLCCFLWLWFRWLCSPPGPDPHAPQSHVSCQNRRLTLCWFVITTLRRVGPYSER